MSNGFKIWAEQDNRDLSSWLLHTAWLETEGKALLEDALNYEGNDLH